METCPDCNGSGESVLGISAHFAPCPICDGQGVVKPDDPTPWCHVCGAMTRKQCSCPDPFYAKNH